MKLKLFLFVIVFFASVVVFYSCEKQIKPFNSTATQFIDNGDGSVTIIDRGEGIGTKTLTADTTWLLQGFVFVNAGQTLTIEPGTLIKGKPGTGENASALIVARGGKINAVGTAQKPIVFTAEADNYEGSGVDIKAQGLWGGLILLGKATTSNLTSEKAIEGIPTSETRGLYGGTDDNDNSGILKYVSIRHGGSDIGEGNEINGLTCGAVGAATSIEYVEVISNKDDGIEFFGGDPQLKHIVVAYCGDDCYDYDEGFHGKGQFWYALQNPDGNRLGEHDGGPSDNETAKPYSHPYIYNATYYGGKGDDGKTITFRDNAGGVYANSIFVHQTKGIDIEYLQDKYANMVQCSYKMFQDALLEMKNNVFFDIVSDTATAYSIFTVNTPKNENGNHLYQVPASLLNAWQNYFSAAGNIISNPKITELDPVPAIAQTSDLAQYPADEFFDKVYYKGAFGDSNWAKGWTLLFKNKTNMTIKH